MSEFKVGQEYVVLDPINLGMADKYDTGDTFMVREIDDDGDVYDKFGYIFVPNDINEGRIKLIKDVPEEPPKLIPRDLACFEEVAKVIGEEGAEKELQEVIDADIIAIGGTDLYSSFEFHRAPQEAAFWYNIAHNKPPKGYVHESSIPTGEDIKGFPESVEHEPEGDSVEVRYVDTDGYSSNHYNLNYTITDEDIERGYIRVDSYFVNKVWKLNSKDDTGILFHQLKTITRFGDKNPVEREIKAMYGQVKRMAEMYNVELED